MRRIRIIAFVVASVTLAAPFAGAQAPAERGARDGRGAMGRGMQARPARALFRGVKLSDAERTSVRQVHDRYRLEIRALHDSMRPHMMAARTARQGGDSVAAKAAWARGQAGREQMQTLFARERAEIRAALSPDNQRAFDANKRAMEARRAGWADGGQRGDGRGSDRPHRGRRG